MIKLFCIFLVFVNLSSGDELSLTKQGGQAFSEGNYLRAGNLYIEACDNGEREGCANLNVLLSSNKLSNNDKMYYNVYKKFKDEGASLRIKTPVVNKNIKYYSADTFIDKASLLTPKDDFETREQYLFRIRQEMGGDVVLIQYPERSISKLKYDLDQQKFNTNFDISTLRSSASKNVGLTMSLGNQKKIERFRKQKGFTEASVDIPCNVEMAKTVKDLPNYGFEIYVLIKIDEKIPETYKKLVLLNGEIIQEAYANAENIIIQNNLLRYYQELL